MSQDAVGPAPPAAPQSAESPDLTDPDTDVQREARFTLGMFNSAIISEDNTTLIAQDGDSDAIDQYVSYRRALVDKGRFDQVCLEKLLKRTLKRLVDQKLVGSWEGSLMKVHGDTSSSDTSSDTSNPKPAGDNETCMKNLPLSAPV
jgi:hypothetical protein